MEWSPLLGMGLAAEDKPTVEIFEVIKIIICYHVYANEMQDLHVISARKFVFLDSS